MSISVKMSCSFQQIFSKSFCQDCLQMSGFWMQFVQVCTEVCWGLSGSKYRVTPKCKPCRPQTVQTMQTEYFLFLFSFLRLLLTRILFCSCHKLVFNDILECHAQAALARYVTCRIPESSPCSISIDPGFAVINHRTSGSWLLFIQWIEVCSEN